MDFGQRRGRGSRKQPKNLDIDYIENSSKIVPFCYMENEIQQRFVVNLQSGLRLNRVINYINTIYIHTLNVLI